MINEDSYQRAERVLEEALSSRADLRETAQIVAAPSPWLWCPDHVPPVGAPVITLDQGMPMHDVEVHVPDAPWTGVECWWMPVPPPPAGWSADAVPSGNQEKTDISSAEAPGANEDHTMDALPAGVSPDDAVRPMTLEEIAAEFSVPTYLVEQTMGSNHPAEGSRTRHQDATRVDTDQKEDPAMDALQTGGMLGYAPRSPSADESAGEVRPDRRAENALRQAAPVALGALAMLDLITSEGGDDVFHGMPRDRQEAYLAEIYNVVQRSHDCMVAFEEQSA